MHLFKKLTIVDVVELELEQASKELLMAQASVESAKHVLATAQSRVAILTDRVNRLNKIRGKPEEEAGEDTVTRQLGGAL